MRAVMSSGPVARADLAVMTGMATGTITKLTSVLGEAGLLQELTAVSRDRIPGRPRVPVAVDDRKYRVVGVHVGLLRTSLCLIDLTGQLVAELRLTHRRRGFDYVMDQAVNGIHELLRGAHGTVVGVGASTGGWVDADSGRVLDHAVLGWRDTPFRGALEEGVKLPVRVDSSFRALALAERWLGEPSSVRDLVQLFVGNVVGAGLVLGGRLYRGATSAAGALDHLPVDGLADEPCTCGRYNCLHVVASDVAVVKHARAQGLVSTSGTVDHVIALARRGNGQADRLLSRRARQVGTAAGILIEVLDPQLVVIGGGVVDAPEYLHHVRQGARGYLADKRPVDVDALIRESSFGTHAISLSSAAILLDELYQDPAAFVPALRDLRQR